MPTGKSILVSVVVRFRRRPVPKAALPFALFGKTVVSQSSGRSPSPINSLGQRTMMLLCRLERESCSPPSPVFVQARIHSYIWCLHHSAGPCAHLASDLRGLRRRPVPKAAPSCALFVMSIVYEHLQILARESCGMLGNTHAIEAAARSRHQWETRNCGSWLPPGMVAM